MDSVPAGDDDARAPDAVPAPDKALLVASDAPAPAPEPAPRAGSTAPRWRPGYGGYGAYGYGPGYGAYGPGYGGYGPGYGGYGPGYAPGYGVPFMGMGLSLGLGTEAALRERYGTPLLKRDSEGYWRCFFKDCGQRVLPASTPDGASNTVTQHILAHEQNGDAVDPAALLLQAPGSAATSNTASAASATSSVPAGAGTSAAASAAAAAAAGNSSVLAALRAGAPPEPGSLGALASGSGGAGVPTQCCTHSLHTLWWGTAPELPVTEFYPRSTKCKRCYVRQQQEGRRQRSQLSAALPMNQLFSPLLPAQHGGGSALGHTPFIPSYSATAANGFAAAAPAYRATDTRRGGSTLGGSSLGGSLGGSSSSGTALGVGGGGAALSTGVGVGAGGAQSSGEAFAARTLAVGGLGAIVPSVAALSGAATAWAYNAPAVPVLPALPGSVLYSPLAQTWVDYPPRPPRVEPDAHPTVAVAVAPSASASAGGGDGTKGKSGAGVKRSAGDAAGEEEGAGAGAAVAEESAGAASAKKARSGDGGAAAAAAASAGQPVELLALQQVQGVFLHDPDAASFPAASFLATTALGGGPRECPPAHAAIDTVEVKAAQAIENLARLAAAVASGEIGLPPDKVPQQQTQSSAATTTAATEEPANESASGEGEEEKKADQQQQEQEKQQQQQEQEQQEQQEQEHLVCPVPFRHLRDLLEELEDGINASVEETDADAEDEAARRREAAETVRALHGAFAQALDTTRNTPAALRATLDAIWASAARLLRAESDAETRRQLARLRADTDDTLRYLPHTRDELCDALFGTTASSVCCVCGFDGGVAYCQGPCHRCFHAWCLGAADGLFYTTRMCPQCARGRPVLYYDTRRQHYYYYWYTSRADAAGAAAAAGAAHNPLLAASECAEVDLEALQPEVRQLLRKADEDARLSELYYDALWCTWRPKSRAIAVRRMERHAVLVRSAEDALAAAAAEVAAGTGEGDDIGGEGEGDSEEGRDEGSMVADDDGDGGEEEDGEDRGRARPRGHVHAREGTEIMPANFNTVLPCLDEHSVAAAAAVAAAEAEAEAQAAGSDASHER